VENAKEEFLNHVAGKTVLCAILKKESDYVLPKEFSETQLNSFLDAIDFVYDNGYGGQKLFGNIWYVDGTWSGRGEYDGAEWWEHYAVPPIPVECTK
jgi:hypothetical protein